MYLMDRANHRELSCLFFVIPSLITVMWFSSIFIPQRACMQVHVEPQAIEYNKREEFNLSLFRKLGTADPEGLGVLGLTTPGEFGGTGFDATACALPFS